MSDELLADAVTVAQPGARVLTPDGAGRVIGSHESRTQILERLEVRGYLVVDLDCGGRRLYKVATVVAAPAPADGEVPS